MGFILSKKSKKCILCKKIRGKRDASNFVLYRGKHTVLLLNLYPYTNGHLMAAPKSHKKELGKLTDAELFELMKTVGLGVEVIRKTMNPDGFNIGINLGRAAGAGIPGHLHVHIVPRWIGDTGFMLSLAETKILPESVKRTYEKLKKNIRSCLTCNTPDRMDI
ncbi:MAG: HIT domain-containing protein [Elusimicrobia bacterium]|nr:HIT domain-containing protein [Elusimicrobiota bacterium]